MMYARERNEMMTLLDHLRDYLTKENIGACFIQNPTTIGYFTQFYSEPHERAMLLVVRPDYRPLLLLPALDFDKARAIVTNIELCPYLDSQNPYTILKETLRLKSHDNYSIDKQYVTLATLENIQRVFNGLQFNHNISPFIERLQLQKSPQEIEKMLEAGKTADLAIKIAANTLAVGKTEVDIVAEIEYQLKKQNVPKMSFDTMILSQKNAANPHGEPSLTPIAYNEFVLMDLGTVHQGYASDMTRTLFFGDRLSKEQETIYHIVLEAHHTARDAAKIGMTAGELDSIARDVITRYGYGDYFTHRLGHGIGQSVHEFPSIASGNDFIIQENMCFSIEPGIYLPQQIGIRIEDCFYITKQGAVPFTNSPYSLNYKDYQ